MPLTIGLLDLPKIFNRFLYQRISNKSDKINKAQFVKFYNSELKHADNYKKLFMLLAKPGAKYIEKDDFKPLLQLLLDEHPGLEFLKSAPEFQDKYGILLEKYEEKNSGYVHLQNFL